MSTALRKALSRASITATRTVTTAPAIPLTPSRSALCFRHRVLSTLLPNPDQGYPNNNNNSRNYSTQHRGRRNKDYSGDVFDNNYSPSAVSTRPGKGEYNGDPDLYRVFFRSPDKMRSLEEAQVFINHIKSSYGPLTQYQFARCPETKKYFGYGFMTFKDKHSLDKALADAYIRVGMKDFELIRSDNNNRNRKPVKFKNTGFSGFNDLEELRAKKKLEEEKSRIVVEEKEKVEVKEQVVVEESGTTFVSALPSSSAEATLATTSTDNSSNDDTRPSVSKPYFVPLQKKGMAQLWKIIPNEIERAEQTFKQTDESEQEPPVAPKVDSKKLAAELVGDILDAKP